MHSQVSWKSFICFGIKNHEDPIFILDRKYGTQVILNVQYSTKLLGKRKQHLPLSFTITIKKPKNVDTILELVTCNTSLKSTLNCKQY